jgi:hypothetical protein
VCRPGLTTRTGGADERAKPAEVLFYELLVQDIERRDGLKVSFALLGANAVSGNVLEATEPGDEIICLFNRQRNRCTRFAILAFVQYGDG